MKFGDLVYIEWTDACEKSGWKSLVEASRIDDEVQVKTIGFFLKQTKDFIIVSCCIGATKKNDVGGVWQIPLAWITKKKRIPLQCKKRL